MQFRTLPLLTLFALALIPRAADAQTSRPSSASARAAAGVEHASSGTIIRRPSDSAPTTRPAGATRATSAFDTRRVVLSLLIVLTLIFALRYLSQRLFGRTVAGRASRAVQVLSRNVISPKQQLLVVRVGRRLVVVGDCGQQMNTLCEITDPDEMAALVGQIEGERRDTKGSPFGAIFGRAGSEFEKDSEPPRPVNVADVGDDDEGDSTGPSNVADTRDELSGLMDKVRGMSRQFRRT
jgi:flagellar biogenesis protein FliO